MRKSASRPPSARPPRAAKSGRRAAAGGSSSPESHARQLAGFLKRYPPDMQSLATRVLAAMRARMPGAVELVYDNYNALVIGFGKTERASEAVFSVALYRSHINLFFLFGAELDDPDGVLRGSGSRVRSIRVDDAAILDRPEVVAVMRRALDAERVRFDGSTRRRVVVRAVSAKERRRSTPGAVRR